MIQTTSFNNFGDEKYFVALSKICISPKNPKCIEHPLRPSHSRTLRPSHSSPPRSNHRGHRQASPSSRYLTVTVTIKATSPPRSPPPSSPSTRVRTIKTYIWFTSEISSAIISFNIGFAPSKSGGGWRSVYIYIYIYIPLPNFESRKELI